MPLDLLDLQGNEGLIAAAAAPVPEALLSQVQQAMHRAGRLPPSGVELVAQVMRALWRFLHDTAHPQVKDASPDDVAFFVMDKITLRKMENALMKILLLGAEPANAHSIALFFHVFFDELGLMPFCWCVELSSSIPDLQTCGGRRSTGFS